MNAHDPRNINFVKGLLVTAFGALFMIFAYTIIFRMILFICGALLLFYGLQLLNISGLNKVIHAIKGYVNKILS